MARIEPEQLKSPGIMDTKHLKLLIAATSFDYDLQLIKNNYDPQKLRQEFYEKFKHSKDICDYRRLEDMGFIGTGTHERDQTTETVTAIKKIILDKIGPELSKNIFSIYFDTDEEESFFSGYDRETTESIKIVTFYEESGKIKFMMTKVVEYWCWHGTDFEEPQLSDIGNMKLIEIIIKFRGLIEKLAEKFGYKPLLNSLNDT